MAYDGKSQREAAERTSGALELASPAESPADGVRSPSSFANGGLGAHKPGAGKETPDRGTGRRPAKRRPAGPARTTIAANDDAPSIGGLIYALQQKPSNKPFQVAAIASGIWVLVSALLAWATHASGGSVFSGPALLVSITAVTLPIALVWFLALLAWRAQELKLMSSAMTEVAVRLAEPDRAAEQSAASLGQAVRRQVSFMNEAISRALGRAGELEAMVHNEVAILEKAYNQNEHKIKGLVQEVVNERHALVSTTDRVAETLKSMGSEVPSLIEKLSQQQIKLAKIIEGAGQNLIALENQLATASGGLETALANRTQQLQAVRRLHGGARRHTRPPCRGTRPTARRAHARSRRGVLGAAGAVRRGHAALHSGHRPHREREGARPLRGHGEPRAGPDRDARPAGLHARPADAQGPRRRAPVEREHHAPVNAGDRGPLEPGADSQGRVGEPRAPDVRRVRQFRQPGPVDRQRRQCARAGQQPHRFGPAGAERQDRPPRPAPAPVLGGRRRRAARQFGLRGHARARGRPIEGHGRRDGPPAYGGRRAGQTRHRGHAHHRRRRVEGDGTAPLPLRRRRRGAEGGAAGGADAARAHRGRAPAHGDARERRRHALGPQRPVARPRAAVEPRLPVLRRCARRT